MLLYLRYFLLGSSSPKLYAETLKHCIVGLIVFYNINIEKSISLLPILFIFSLPGHVADAHDRLLTGVVISSPQKLNGPEIKGNIVRKS